MVERCVRDAEAASSNLVASMVCKIWLRPHGQAVKTTPSHGVNPGSIPGEVIGALDNVQSIFDASVAQLVAQRIRNAWVAGSSPAGSLENTGVLRGKKVRKHRGLRTFAFFSISLT